MHRSGTSAVTRGLLALGVSLGNRLMPPRPGVNDKGFWEDLDIYELNVNILKALSLDWHSFSSINSGHVNQLRNLGFFLTAKELLSDKLSAVDILGIKDPRICRLLPFWVEVFQQIGADIRYLLAIRNPMSVAHSLSRRDKFSAEKSHLLWLSHVLNSLSVCTYQNALIIDYDELLDGPFEQLQKISKSFSLELDPEQALIYEKEFLDQGLRHHTSDSEVLSLKAVCPPLVTEVYRALKAVTAGHAVLGSDEFLDKMTVWTSVFRNLEVAFWLLDNQEKEGPQFRNVVIEYEDQIKLLKAELAVQQQQIEYARATMREKVDELSNLYQSRSWRFTKPARKFLRWLRNVGMRS